MIARHLLSALLGAAAAVALIHATLPPVPRLIGHHCQDSGGDLFAMEESDFPHCEMIERNL